MYLGSQRKNGTVELEIVGEIPKTERLDTDVISPVSYDDLFEIIPNSRGGKHGNELKIDISEDLKSQMTELLRFCGIHEFDEEDSVQLEENGKHTKANKDFRSVKPLKAHSIGPPFLVRLMRYNLLENKFPNFFDFGVNLTLPASFQVSEYRLLKTVHPRDNPWYKGCRKLILLGIPSFLRPQDLKEIILSFAKKPECNLKMKERNNENLRLNLKSPSQRCFSVMELGIKNFTNLFTTENKDYYLNNLYQPCGAIVKSHMNMALLEFQEEEDALEFWVALSTGLFQCYGSVLTAIPDPSGKRIIAEGMLTVFSPKNVPLLESVESSAKTILQKDFSSLNEVELFLSFPLIGSPRSIDTIKSELIQVFKDIPESDSYVIEETTNCLTIHSKIQKVIELINNRLFQHCTFKMISETDNRNCLDENLQIVNTAMFIFREKVCEPVIIQGNYDIHPVKHCTIEFGASNKKREKNSKVSFSSANHNDQDTEPVGFLFKKFEELREALQHGLAPISNNSEDQNINSSQNGSSNTKGLLRTPSEMGMMGESNTPSITSNTENIISKKLSGVQINGSFKDEQESFVQESPDSHPRRSNNRKRTLKNLDNEEQEFPIDSNSNYNNGSGLNRDNTQKPEDNKAERFTSKRRTSVELPRKSIKSSSYKRES
ncbi:uncharacterized protein cubi_03208 [Cryptosporidium ubiquitum]|uniref:Uncharacterized protein n=1 Tax=Cryptosporidium ubiquitum TaxID=857276 RepID=A0A1J4MLW8_9CRYT|nr:uncharacterized protein cubi_03208 [Cryptosporidium ubiquitum]OII75192.1 hypothetical protein cubi_03208 [Cryptosporidium ubiquitum]